MNTKTFILAIVASTVLASPVLAQSASGANTENTVEKTVQRKEREPVDLAKFTRMDELKAADTNNDGILSREEIEAYAQKMMVKRAADRMERRLDVNGDGKISLAAIEKHRTERFAELDKNKDGKLDRSELKAGKHHGKDRDHRKNGEHRKNGDHGKHSPAE
jgi:hypothetical protein